MKPRYGQIWMSRSGVLFQVVGREPTRCATIGPSRFDCGAIRGETPELSPMLFGTCLALRHDVPWTIDRLKAMAYGELPWVRCVVEDNGAETMGQLSPDGMFCWVIVRTRNERFEQRFGWHAIMPVLNNVFSRPLRIGGTKDHEHNHRKRKRTPLRP